MKGATAIYLGKIVDKNSFRTFIYHADRSTKLVESWDEYEEHMQSGLWFSTLEDASSRVPVAKPKRTRKAKAPELIEDVDVLMAHDEPVRDDDFLPKGD